MEKHMVTGICSFLIAFGITGVGIRKGWSDKKIWTVIFLITIPAIIAREFFNWNGFKL